MLKKYTSILLIYTAFTIVLAHNLIPHHHHENEAELSHHHHHGHHGDHQEGSLNHMLSHILHSSDVFITIITNLSTPIFYKEPFSLDVLLPDYIILDNFLIPPLLPKQPTEDLNYIFTYTHPSGLRGPPAC